MAGHEITIVPALEGNLISARETTGSLESLGICCTAGGTKACSTRPPPPNAIGCVDCGAIMCSISGRIVPTTWYSGAVGGAVEPVEASSSCIVEGAVIRRRGQEGKSWEPVSA